MLRIFSPIRTLIAPVALAGCVSAHGRREPLVSDRPDFTESASTVAPRHVQLEGGHTVARVAHETSHSSGEILVRVGVSSRAELRFEPGSFTRVSSPAGTANGREDGSVGVKVRLHDAGPAAPWFNPTVALIARSSVPTGSSEFRQARVQPEIKLAAAWDLSERLGVGANFNVARPVDADGRFTELSASLSLGAAVSSALGAYAEVFGFAPQRAGIGRTHYANAGTTVSVTPDLQLDLRVGRGLNGASPDHFVGAGIVWRW